MHYVIMPGRILGGANIADGGGGGARGGGEGRDLYFISSLRREKKEKSKTNAKKVGKQEI